MTEQEQIDKNRARWLDIMLSNVHYCEHCVSLGMHQGFDVTDLSQYLQNMADNILDEQAVLISKYGVGWLNEL